MKYKTHTYIDKKPWTFHFNFTKRNIDYTSTFGSCQVGLALRVRNWVMSGRFGPKGKNFGLVLVGLNGN